MLFRQCKTGIINLDDENCEVLVTMEMTVRKIVAACGGKLLCGTRNGGDLGGERQPGGGRRFPVCPPQRRKDGRPHLSARRICLGRGCGR
jgi:hypothetical protein